MNEKDVAVNSLKAWVLAARPKTLTSAAVPVLLGIALARGCLYEIKVLPAVLCMLFAFLMQIDANFVNDYLILCGVMTMKHVLAQSEPVRKAG